MTRGAQRAERRPRRAGLRGPRSSPGRAAARIALAIAIALAAAGCSRPAAYTVRQPPAPARPPPGEAKSSPTSAVPAGAERPLRVLLFGDFGEPNEQQAAVARMMLDAHRRRPFDLAFSLGDNVYPCGLDPTLPGAEDCSFDAAGAAPVEGYEAPRDERFAKRFERPLLPFADGPNPIPVYGVLGNHDVAAGFRCREGPLGAKELARLRACLTVAQRSPVWRMPGRHYFVDHGPARFVVIDTNLLIRDYGGFTIDDEVAFVREAARGAAGRRVFLVGHHPAATAGGHRDEFDRDYLERLARLLEAGGGAVSAWLAGHDHDLQHVRLADLDVFVSGNGSLDRPHERFEFAAPQGAHVAFASTAWGFAVLEVTRSGWSVRFEGDAGEPLYCCRASGSGRCDTSPCAQPGAPVGARIPPDLP